MIVEMSRVLIVGPKRLLGRVVDEVQRAGAVHIDRVETDEHAIETLKLDEQTLAEQSRLEAARIRLTGLLGLLPQVPGPASGDGDSPQDPLPGDPEAVEAAIISVEAEVHELSRRRLEAEEERELIRTYEGAVRALSPLLGALAGSRSFETIGFMLRGKDLTVVAALHNQLRVLTEGRVEVVSRAVDEGRIGVVVAFLRRDADAVRGLLTRAGIAELRLPERYGQGGPSEAIRIMEERRAALPAELATVNAALADAARRHRTRLEALRGFIADRLAQLQAAAQVAGSRYMFILHGWAPSAKVAALRDALQGRFGRDVVIVDEPPDPHHTAEVPVVLDNHPVLKPFQRMLGLFKPPRYGTLDPTVYLAIFFPVFVGMVIGDAAYGALLFTLGWWMRNKARRGETWDVEIPVVHVKLGMQVKPAVLVDMSWIVRILATWTILFGVLYLEFFGNLIEHHLGLHPIFNRVEFATAFLALTIALGIVQVMLGYILHLILALRHRHAFGALESLAMICGVAALFVLLGALGKILPSSFFTPGLVLLAAFVVFVLAGIILRWSALMWLLEAISGMGNVMSYARLFGVGLAAAVLANVSNQLGGMVGPVWIGIVVGISIQMLFFVLTFAGHVIQPARLNWVEFLTKVKYHDETGNSYRPLQKTGGE